MIERTPKCIFRFTKQGRLQQLWQAKELRYNLDANDWHNAYWVEWKDVPTEGDEELDYLVPPFMENTED